MFDKPLRWLRKHWWGLIIAHFLLLISIYFAIWKLIEPLNIEKVPNFTGSRVFYHLILTLLIAAYLTLILDLLVRYSVVSETKQTSSSLNQWVKGATNQPHPHLPPQDIHRGNPKEQLESDRGIISKVELKKSDERKQGEVFTIELLNEPITLEREGGQTLVKIDRRNVSQCIITNAGKTEAVLKYVAGNEDALRKEDKEIQHFLNGTSSESRKIINLRDLHLRLRWASGGVLSIVTIDGKDYVPLLFRDIRPYGWNLMLGSTERCFKENGKLDPSFGIEDEWDDPLSYLRREFLEETLVIDDVPTPEESSVFKKFEVHPKEFVRLQPPGWRDRVRRFAEEQAVQREKEDKFTIKWDTPIPLKIRPGEGNARVQIFSSSRKRWLPPTDDVLVAFSLLDLGIEVIQVYKYSLEPNDYMLDGEILQDKADRKELVRMPIALISCSYLAEIFGQNEGWYHYTFGPEPSIEVQRPPTADEVRLFDWDVRRRMEILRHPKHSIGSQHRRFLDWYDKFGKDFVDREGRPSRNRLPGLFVPGTAKILNQYFSMPDVFDKYIRVNPSQIVKS